MQNTSHAVMSQRIEPQDSPDDFPTPPWATRALLEHTIGTAGLGNLTCLEPACGAGHMVRVLKEYFKEVTYADAYDYGLAPVRDFLSFPYETNAVDWVITNPPFRLAEDFFHQGFRVANVGVALLVRTVFLESIGRLERLFSKFPPTLVAQFSERVPMVRGRLDRKASTATGYAWVVWIKPLGGDTRLIWIPPCRKRLERETDYPATDIGVGEEPRVRLRPLDLLSRL